jgi:two-component system, NarL family, response regulator LiaR
MRQLKLLLADDHRLMLEAIRLALAGEPDLEIVGEAQNGSQVLPLVNQTRPDVVLLDIRMPQMDGLRCLELLRQRHPEVKVVVLSAAEDSDMIDAAFRRGAAAYILKQVDPRDLASAVRQAFEGTVIQRPGSTAADPGRDAAKELALTERELSILKHLSAGLSNKQIARELWLAEQTVKFHLTSIYRKLNVTSRAEAIHRVYEQHLIESDLVEKPVTSAA